MPGQTPSQTVGPFFAHALTPEGSGPSVPGGAELAAADGPDAPILIAGRVLDGAGAPVPDAMLEIWQADASGRYPTGTDGFRGFGRAGTDSEGRFAFRTVKPGGDAPDAAPHVNVVVFARGLLNHAFTRIYFSDEEAANRIDPVLARLEEERRATLVAAKRRTDGIDRYEFTIRLQGAAETVFFDP